MKTSSAWLIFPAAATAFLSLALFYPTALVLGLVPVSMLTVVPYVSLLGFRLSGCAMIVLSVARWRRALPTARLLLVVGTLIVLAGTCLLRSNLLRSQKTMFLHGLAAKLQTDSFLNDISAWRRESLAKLRSEGASETQLEDTNLSATVRGLFPGHFGGATVGLGRTSGNQIYDYGAIIFRDGPARWGVKLGPQEVQFGWTNEVICPVTNDVRVFFGDAFN